MAEVMEDIKLEDIPVDDIDFSDLEAQYRVEGSLSFDMFAVVDGAPIAPESKVPALHKVLSKLFSQAGEIKDMDIPVENGKTKGHLFIEFDSAESTRRAIKLFNGKKLDVKHRLFVNSLNDMEKYCSPDFSVGFKEPNLPPYEPTGYLRSWLQDPQGRDQFVLQKGEKTAIYWYRNHMQPEAVVEPRKNWSNSIVKFSPHGSYLFSFHDQGIASWGGPQFSRLKRFFHPNVKAISISPTEKYLVTFSPEPLDLPGEPNEDCPFGPESQGHQLCIWDISTGVCVKTFALPPQQELQWPMVKWSFDDKYCARMGPNAIAVYETEKSFQLLNGKVMKIEGLQDFSFAPKGVKLASNSPNTLSTVMAYWTPETNNQSCKAVIMEMPHKRILRTVNLVQVTGVSFHWQNESEYLCVQVDRHTKSRKTIFTNLEICKLTEREIPFEKVELKDRCMRFAWEPSNDRFVTISKSENVNDNPAIAKNVVSFYAPEKKADKGIIISKGISDMKKWKLVKAIEGKFSNEITWSPAGRFVCVAAIGKMGSRNENLDFYDLDFPSEKIINSATDVAATLRDVAHVNYANATDFQWDSSGRFISFWSSAWKHKAENGYRVFNLCGNLIREELITEFNNFFWRPRPECTLTNAEKKKVRKNLKEWASHFEEQDAMEADSATRELILTRRTWLEEWSKYRSETSDRIKSEGASTFDVWSLNANEKDFETIEEIKESIVEESVEEVTSFD
ncbi:HDL187Cp [Eremothecium sinecaudum]|uniref:Eukaryotic translation initiation factor 3 subunit B n=1 Tax=Eremothecium sinecaudum TaxID=45286 RepID=A0A0X8HS84_9SACH|nr:HDL187Cp [Eremothecium sinecaudum]AMD20557.1 HDL187Cp [Eremothecium sinecaudum]